MADRNRVFTGVLPDGTHVLVTIWPDPEDSAEVAFRDHTDATWGPPTQLVEEP